MLSLDDDVEKLWTISFEKSFFFSPSLGDQDTVYNALKKGIYFKQPHVMRLQNYFYQKKQHLLQLPSFFYTLNTVHFPFIKESLFYFLGEVFYTFQKRWWTWTELFVLFEQVLIEKPIFCTTKELFLLVIRYYFSYLKREKLVRISKKGVYLNK